MIKIGIIGGGASGIMAAIKAANEGALVTILERKESIGKKLLVTGNGRCNFTNKNMSSSCYYTDDVEFVTNTLDKFSKDDLLSFFKLAGVLCKEKNGYYYPASEQASTILDALKNELSEREVKIVTGCDVVNIEKLTSCFKVTDSDNNTYYFDKLIVSTGGKAGLSKNERANGYSLLKTLGVNSTKTCPALTSLTCKGFDFKKISGVRSECCVTLYENESEIMKDYGEVLFNDTGISGIVTFQLSHAALEGVNQGKNVTVWLDLLPGLDADSLKAFINAKVLLHPEQNLNDFISGFHNKKLCLELLNVFGLDKDIKVCNIAFEKICDCILALKNLKFEVSREASYDKAQVTGGGILLSEISSSFEVKSVKGLYVTGELLNVDGLCGGYNLQWAFSSGYIAGENAAKGL